MKSLVIFDLDGTILNTIKDLQVSLNVALSRHSLPTQPLANVTRFVGNGLRKLVERSLPQGTSEEVAQSVLKTFVNYYAAHSSSFTKPYRGILQLMKRLKARGVKIAVVSNKADVVVQQLCSHFFPLLVDFALGEKENIAPKPNPQPVLVALNVLHVSAENALFVGDSEVDVETARNASVECLSVLWGFRAEQELVNCGATNFAHSANDVWKFVL